MATTLSTTGTLLIHDAMRLAGLKDMGNDPSPEEIEFGLRMLNTMIKQWETRGVKLHTFYDLSVPQYGSKSNYSIMSSGGDVTLDRPMRVVSARRKVNATLYETEISLISREDYERITIKASVGAVSQVFYDRQLNYGTLYVWPVSDALVSAPTYDVILNVQRAIGILSTVEDVPDLPSEQYLALIYGLAEILADGGVLGIPERQLLTAKAKDYLNQLLMTDQETTSFFFQPVMR